MTDDEMRAEAVRVLRLNDRGRYTVPTAKLYPYRWFWDSAMTAIGWAHIDKQRAWAELDASMSGQWPSGMVPHIDFGNVEGAYFPGPEAWGVPHRTTGITQPPLTAVIARIVLENAKDQTAARAAATALYPKLVALQRWLYSVRQAGDTGLLLCTHPWETGMDNSPAWDVPMTAIDTDGLPPYDRKDTTHVDHSERPPKIFYDRCYALLLQLKDHGYDTREATDASSFAIADPCFNAIAVKASEDLVWLGEELGLDAGEAREWLKAGESGLARLWSDEDGNFISYDWKAQRTTDASTSAGFFALNTEVPTEQQVDRMAATFDSWLSHVSYGLPSFDPAHDSYDSRRYWRGPSWINVNFVVAQGFARHGRSDLAERLRSDSRELVRRAGMWEYFEPHTGEGLGAHDFSWSSALTLHWLS
jgi:hypothetical protein